MKSVLDIDTGVEQMQLGLAAVALNNADLMLLARDVAKLLSMKYGSVTIDMVRAHESLKDRHPSSPNFWGCVFHEKGWRCVRYEPSQIKSNHHRVIGRWRWEP